MYLSKTINIYYLTQFLWIRNSEVVSWFAVSGGVTIKMSAWPRHLTVAWGWKSCFQDGASRWPWPGGRSSLPCGPLHTAACVSSRHGHGASDEGGGCNAFRDLEVTLPHFRNLVLVTPAGVAKVSGDYMQQGAGRRESSGAGAGGNGKAGDHGFFLRSRRKAI